MAKADEVALEIMDVQKKVLIETERATPRKRRVEIEKRHPATSQCRTRQQMTVGRVQQR